MTEIQGRGYGATIAITGVGMPLGQSLVRAALASDRRYVVITLDVDELARDVFPQLPFRQSVHIKEPAYLDKMAAVVRDVGADLVFLGSESEMLGMAVHRQEFERATGARLALGNDRALEVGMDKFLTVECLKNAGLPYPETLPLDRGWSAVREFARTYRFPLVVKGRRAGLPQIARSEDDLAYHLRTYADGVVQEFLGVDDPREFTVGLFRTPVHGITGVYCMARELRYGLTWRGHYDPNPAVEDMCRRAVDALSAEGSVNAQVRFRSGLPVLHEFNVRCSSTTVFRALSGWNEIDMAVDWFLKARKPESPTPRPGRAVRFFDERWTETG